jgi:hypothetical protein
MSYMRPLRPKRPPVHRPYAFKQHMIRAWMSAVGGEITLVDFCRSKKIAVSTFEKWWMTKDKILSIPADKVNKHVVSRSRKSKSKTKKRADPRVQVLNDWLSFQKTPFDMAAVRLRVGDLWPEWLDEDRSEWKTPHYFAKWCLRHVREYVASVLERSEESTADDDAGDDGVDFDDDDSNGEDNEFGGDNEDGEDSDIGTTTIHQLQNVFHTEQAARAKSVAELVYGKTIFLATTLSRRCSNLRRKDRRLFRPRQLQAQVYLCWQMLLHPEALHLTHLRVPPILSLHLSVLP